MKCVGLIHGFILPGYEAMHTQSREHVTEDVLGALQIWEQKQGVVDKYLRFTDSYQVKAYVE